MGFYSVVVILHDQLSGIINHPKQFVENLDRAIGQWIIPFEDRTIRGGGGCCNPAQIVAQDHADNFHMLVTGGNTAWDLGVCGRWSPHFRDNMTEEDRAVYWLKVIADKYGYALRKKRKTK